MPGQEAELWEQAIERGIYGTILYIKNNKAEDNDWFNIKPKDKSGTFWEGKCWNYYEGLKYELNLRFAIPATYPAAAPDVSGT